MALSCCSNPHTLRLVGQTALLLKIIAEENRLKILCVLKMGPQCVCDIWEDLGIAQNLASHHLKVLKEAGLIDSRKEGLKVIYSINTKGMKRLQKDLQHFLQSYGTK